MGPMSWEMSNPPPKAFGGVGSGEKKDAFSVLRRYHFVFLRVMGCKDSWSSAISQS